MSQLKYTIRQSPLFKPLKSLKDRYEFIKWNLAGKPVPPPYIIKRKVIRDYALKYKAPVFFETGTAAGDTTAVVAPLFKKVFSIEINKHFYENAKKRFANDKKIEIINGDSGKVMPDLMKNKIDTPVLFWLDGHYNSLQDVKSSNEQVCPIFEELETIFIHPIKNHIMLIDDARLFTGKEGYPTLEEVKNFTSSKRPDLSFYVDTDIIRIHQK